MEMGLSEVYMIIRDIQNCSSTKAKQHIVKSNANNETFKKILMYAYNDMQYGVKKTTISKMEFNPNADYLWNNIWSMFEDLAKSNINNDLVLKISNTIGYFANENVRDLLIRVLLKDLKIGMNVKSINKAINGLIPMFDVMKASSYDDKKFIGSVLKQARVKQEGFDELDKAFQNMPDGYLYEGEILKVGEFNTSKEQFKETDKIYSIKGKKRNLMIKLFDLIPLDKFNEGEWGVKAIERKKMLKEFIDKNNHPLVQFADIIYQGTDISIIQKKLEEVSKDGYKEGLMVMLNDGKYEAKRTKLILKCKLFNTIDLRVVDIKESKEKPGTMGSAIVMYKGNTVGVSGWKEEDKIYYYQNPQELIGKIIEIKFKEVTVDKNGVESLQFPNVVRIRFDKDEESYE